MAKDLFTTEEKEMAIRDMQRRGLRNYQIAPILGVSTTSIDRWSADPEKAPDWAIISIKQWLKIKELEKELEEYHNFFKAQFVLLEKSGMGK